MSIYSPQPLITDKSRAKSCIFQTYDDDLKEDSQEWKDTKARITSYLPRYRALWFTYNQEKHEASDTSMAEEKLDVEYEADDEMVICCDKQKCTCGIFSFVPPELLEIQVNNENQADAEVLSEPEWDGDNDDDDKSTTSSSTEADSSGDSTCVAFDVSWLPSPDGSQATNNDHAKSNMAKELSLKEQIIQRNICSGADDVGGLHDSSFSDDKENDSQSKPFRFQRKQTIVVIDTDDDTSASDKVKDSCESIGTETRNRSIEPMRQVPRHSFSNNRPDIDNRNAELKNGIIQRVDKGRKDHRRFVIDSSDEESTQSFGAVHSVAIKSSQSKRNRVIFDGDEEEHKADLDIGHERHVGGLLEKIKALSLRNENVTLKVDDNDSDNELMGTRKHTSSKQYFDLVDSEDDIEDEELDATSEEEDARKGSKVKRATKQRDSFIVDSDDDYDDESDELGDNVSLEYPVPLSGDNKHELKQCDKLSKLAFRRNREQLAQTFFAEFDKNVFDGKLSEKTKVKWSNKLRTTAGLTRLKAVRQGKEIVDRCAVVELSTKVLEDSQRLRATLMHELCHAAQWMEDGVSKPAHGEVFKKWARLATQRMPDILVTVRHDYEISFKYTWKCAQCNGLLKRHSRSINVDKHVCGRCRGRLVEVDNDGLEKSQTAKNKRPPSAYNQFIKDNSSLVRSQLEKSQTEKVSQAQVLKQCAQLWKENSNA